MESEGGTTHDNLSMVSLDTFHSLDDLGVEEQARISQTDLLQQPHSHKTSGVSPGHSNEPTNIHHQKTTRSSYFTENFTPDCPRNPAALSPKQTPLARPPSLKPVTFTESISKKDAERPQSTLPWTFFINGVKWIPVHDPLDLMGLALHPALAGMEKRSKVVGLPPAPLHAIFDRLDPCTATCFGLTCRKLYYFSKYKYPGKISLWESGPGENEDQPTLGDLVAQWVGSRYRRHIWGPQSIPKEHAFKVPQFLIRDVYGAAAGGKAEIELAKRYRDYYASEIFDDEGQRFILPHPFNKGKAWYDEARKCIMNDTRGHHIHSNWNWNEWMSYWLNCRDIFGRISYMEKLRVLQQFEYEEWVESMQIEGAGLLAPPSGADELWWTVKRCLRWVSWWVGDLPARQPFPGPKPGQRRQRSLSPQKLQVASSFGSASSV